MNVPSPINDEDNGEETYIDESDIINEYEIDEEELPDADEEGGSDGEAEFDGVDDSIHIFTGHTGELYSAACSPTDASLVATGGGDDKGFLWRISQGDWAFELQGHQDSVSSLSFSMDGQLLASGSLDGVVKVWDISNGNLKCTLDGPSGGIEWVRWHPKGHLVLAGAEDSSVWMWNADKDAYLNVFSGHGGSVTCGDFTPDGKSICTGSDDATLKIWNPKNAEIIHDVKGHPYHTEGITCLTISSDSALVLSGSSDGSVHVVNISTGKVVSSLSAHSDSVECAAFQASSRRDSWRVATGGMDKKLIIWDQHSTPRCICEHEEAVTCLIWLSGSRYIATGCVDGKVRIWDSLSGDCTKVLMMLLSIRIQYLQCNSISILLSMDGMDNVLELLRAASGSSTLKESLECLIETAKTSDGRLDLARKQIIIPALRLCQSPLQLSSEDLFLSVKLLRNLCAGEIENQNLFVLQNGVATISALVSSMGLVSSSGNRRTHNMVLQLLGNVSLAGEKHRAVVWRQMFPLGFRDIAGVQSKETCDTLCMIIYTCVEGSSERSVELLGDAGLDVVVGIIRTATIVGFREQWLKLLLSKLCFEDSYFSPVFSKLSPAAEAENSDTNVARINNFGGEQALLLSVLSEILNEHLGDIVVPNAFSLLLFEILRNAVGIVDFSTRGKSPLPTGSADVDVMGYSMTILRDICACQDPAFKNQDEEGDAVDTLVSAGLIKFLIELLRNLEPPAIIRKDMVNNNEEEGSTSQKSSKYQCPYRGFRRDLVAIIGNCSYRKKHVQDEIREEDGILLLLQQCVTDEDNPFLREWGLWSMRNVFEGNEENQKLVAELELQRSVVTPEIAELGLRVEVDPQTQRPKLVNA